MMLIEPKPESKKNYKGEKMKEYTYSQCCPCNHSHNDHRSDIKMFKTYSENTPLQLVIPLEF